MQGPRQVLNQPYNFGIQPYTVGVWAHCATYGGTCSCKGLVRCSIIPIIPGLNPIINPIISGLNPIINPIISGTPRFRGTGSLRLLRGKVLLQGPCQVLHQPYFFGVECYNQPFYFGNHSSFRVRAHCASYGGTCSCKGLVRCSINPTISGFNPIINPVISGTL